MKVGASMSPAQREMVRTAKDRMAPKLTRHDFGQWALDIAQPRCSLHAITRGSSRSRSRAVGEGYSGFVTGSEQRHGEERYDCSTRKQFESMPTIGAQWKGDTRILELELPGLTVDEQSKTADGKTTTRRVTIGDIKLDDLHWAGKGPQSGQKTRQIMAGGIPATMTIHWTFTPGKA
jgi:hypothetical protein